MSLLSYRTARPALVSFSFAVLVLLLLALPIPSHFHPGVSAVGPNVAWAGSPDETLKPPPNPPKSSRVVKRPENITTASSRTLSRRALIEVLVRVYWATVRF